MIKKNRTNQNYFWRKNLSSLIFFSLIFSFFFSLIFYNYCASYQAQFAVLILPENNNQFDSVEKIKILKKDLIFLTESLFFAQRIEQDYNLKIFSIKENSRQRKKEIWQKIISVKNYPESRILIFQIETKNQAQTMQLAEGTLKTFFNLTPLFLKKENFDLKLTEDIILNKNLSIYFLFTSLLLGFLFSILILFFQKKLKKQNYQPIIPLNFLKNNLDFKKNKVNTHNYFPPILPKEEAPYQFTQKKIIDNQEKISTKNDLKNKKSNKTEIFFNNFKTDKLENIQENYQNRQEEQERLDFQNQAPENLPIADWQNFPFDTEKIAESKKKIKKKIDNLKKVDNIQTNLQLEKNLDEIQEIKNRLEEKVDDIQLKNFDNLNFDSDDSLNFEEKEEEDLNQSKPAKSEKKSRLKTETEFKNPEEEPSEEEYKRRLNNLLQGGEI